MRIVFFIFSEGTTVKPPPSVPPKQIDSLLNCIRHLISSLIKALCSVVFQLLHEIIGNLLDLLNDIKSGDTPVDIDQLLEVLINLGSSNPAFLTVINAILESLHLDGSKVLKLLPPFLSATPIELRDLIAAVVQVYNNGPPELNLESLTNVVGDALVEPYLPNF